MRGTCETCDYWAMKKNEEVTEVTDHECHRYPPNVPVIRHVNDIGIECHLLTTGNDSTYMTYPRTFFDEWCGEWRERQWEPTCQ